MSVKRRVYIIKGKRYTSRYYSIDFVGADGQQYRRATKCQNRQAAEKMERDLRVAVERGTAGIIDRTQAKAPLLDLIDKYQIHLETLGRDDMYAYTAGRRLHRLALEAGWRCLADISVASFNDWRARGTERHKRKPGAKTINQYLDHARAFMEWAKKQGRCSTNPLDAAEHSRVLANPYYRRSATEDELRKLLAAAPESRRLAYSFTIYCPLRRDTISQLRWNDLHLDAEKPWGIIRPETNKTRQPERFPIPRHIAAMLVDAKGKAKPTARVFAYLPTVDDLRTDLAAAGVPFSDANGNRRLDFHAFRRTAISLLKRAGVSIDEAKAILHHKHVATTQRYYDEQPDPIAIGAVEKLPDLTK